MELAGNDGFSGRRIVRGQVGGPGWRGLRIEGTGSSLFQSPTQPTNTQQKTCSVPKYLCHFPRNRSFQNPNLLQTHLGLLWSLMLKLEIYHCSPSGLQFNACQLILANFMANRIKALVWLCRSHHQPEKQQAAVFTIKPLSNQASCQEHKMPCEVPGNVSTAKAAMCLALLCQQWEGNMLLFNTKPSYLVTILSCLKSKVCFDIQCSLLTLTKSSLVYLHKKYIQIYA